LLIPFVYRLQTFTGVTEEPLLPGDRIIQKILYSNRKAKIKGEISFKNDPRRWARLLQV
jgi:hypothetical protein